MIVFRPVLICADDYALAPGVSDAILELLAARRLSATGCMTVSPFWPEHGARLKAVAAPAAVGLHLTLTDHRPLGPCPALLAAAGGTGERFPPLGRLLTLALTGRLQAEEIAAEIAAEIHRQIAAFEAVFSHPPAFLDGHQHVHLFPGVREPVQAAAAARPGTWVRDCRETFPAILRRGVAAPKAAFLSLLGQAAGRALAARGLAGNQGFRGVHDFSGRPPFAHLLARFLAPGGNAGALPPLLMCHPGFPDAQLRALDPVCEARQAEYEALAGPVLPELLARFRLFVLHPGD